MFDESLITSLNEALITLNQDEVQIDTQLTEIKQNLYNNTILNKTLTKLQIYKNDQFYDAILNDSEKLLKQINDCMLLSQYMNNIVLNIDNKQINIQQILAYTEDIINLKNYKFKLSEAIENYNNSNTNNSNDSNSDNTNKYDNLIIAINYIKQFQLINQDVAKASDDYNTIIQYIREVRIMTQTEYNTAIKSNNINNIITLYPLLSILNLNYEKNEMFMEYMNTHVFIAISADLHTPNSTGTGTGSSTSKSDDNDTTNLSEVYTKTISNIFNSTYLIFQNYLPIILQSMNDDIYTGHNFDGHNSDLSPMPENNNIYDIIFIRKLHSKCESQISIILKRYIKYRNIKHILQHIHTTSTTATSNTKSMGVTSGTITSPSLSGGNLSIPNTAADIHIILDEIVLIIKFCITYLKYLNSLVISAEKRDRGHNSYPPNNIDTSTNTNNTTTKYNSTNSVIPTTTTTTINNTTTNNTTNNINNNTNSNSNNYIVFQEPTAYHNMVNELIDRYYIEIEVYIINSGFKTCITQLFEYKQILYNIPTTTSNTYNNNLLKINTSSFPAIHFKNLKFDECFYLLRRCSMRAINTYNIHTTCIILRKIIDILNVELFKVVADLTRQISDRLVSVLSEEVMKYIRYSMGYDSSANTTSGGGAGGGMGEGYNSNNNTLNKGKSNVCICTYICLFALIYNVYAQLYSYDILYYYRQCLSYTTSVTLHIFIHISFYLAYTTRYYTILYTIQV